MWFTSDLHLGHANIIGYCDRPFDSARHMDRWLVDAWNEVVGTGDEVWVLGDVAMGDMEASLRLVGQLAGVKHLVAGNHDKVFRRTGAVHPEWEQRYRDAGFASVHHGSVVLRAHRLGLERAGDVRLCHFPYTPDPFRAGRLDAHRPDDNGLVLLHGHTHGRWRRRGVMVDVGVDAWGGRPVHAATINELLDAEGDAEALAWGEVAGHAHGRVG